MDNSTAEIDDLTYDMEGLNVQAHDLRIPCEYCAGTRPLPRPEHGPYVDCVDTTDPGDRDNGECSICTDELNDEQLLIKHTVCQHVFHKACFDAWIDTNVAMAVRAGPVTCGQCRQPIMQLTMPSALTIHFTVATALEHHRMAQMVREDIPVAYVPKPLLGSFVYNRRDKNPEAGNFYLKNMLRQSNGKFPKYRLPRTRRRGAAIFSGQSFTQAGVLYVLHCDHHEEQVLLTGEQMYNTLSEMFAAGWCPRRMTARPRLRIRSSYQTLANLADAVRQLGPHEVEVNTYELAAMCSDTDWFRAGLKLHVKMRYDNNPQGWLTAGICMYIYDPEQRDVVVLCHADALKFVHELGGFGRMVKVVRLGGNVQQRATAVRIHHRAYAELTRPFADKYPSIC